MVRREEKQGDEECWKRDGTGNLHDTPGLVVGGQQLVVEETVEYVTDEDLELALFAPWRDCLGLNAQREYRVFGRVEETKSPRHDGLP
jgi:hypothetical protein